MKSNNLWGSFLCLLFLGPTAQAWEAPVFQGEYVFAEDRLEVLLEKEEILLKALTLEGQNHMRDLRGQGYICEARGAQVFSCVRKVLKAELPGPVKDEVIAEFRGRKLSFMGRPSAMEVLNGAERLVEWRVWQNVSIFEHIFTSAKYILMRTPHEPDLLKLHFSDSEKNFYLVQQGHDFVSIFVKNLAKQKTKDFYLAHSQSYTIALLFSPVAR